MAAIVKQESGGQPWTINDNNGKRSYRLGSKTEAVLKATELISAGHSVDMGLVQINSKNLGWLGLSVEQVFDPCMNIAAGARVLENGYKKTGSLPDALSMYNTGRANSGIGRRYAESVFRHAGVAVPAIPGGKLADLPALDVPVTQTAGLQKSRPAASAGPEGFSPRWF
ncbi:hypothetical protein MASR1M60_22460 [Rhodocyclaceae bacterium]